MYEAVEGACGGERVKKRREKLKKTTKGSWKDTVGAGEGL